MAISFYSEGVTIPAFRRRVVSAWIKSVAQSYGKQVGDISYQFCDDEKILEINRKYLRHDYYTDVITFDQSIDDILFADIIISLDTVSSNAVEYQRPFEEELMRVIIHGVLHICGEDDKSPEAKVAMRAAEGKALDMLPEDKSDLWRR